MASGKKLWAQYQHYTRDLTVHGRVLGAAGAGVCWLFKDDAFRFPTVIYVSLLFFTLFFLFDILHGLTGALMVRYFTFGKEAELWEKTRSIDGEIDVPRWLDKPAFFFFILKCLLLMAGFVCIALELLGRIR